MARSRKENEYREKKRRSPVRVIFGWIAFIFLFVLILFILSPLIGASVTADSGAMSPAIGIGDTVAVNHIAYLLLPPHRGDIIQFRIAKEKDDPSTGDESAYIRRIIALPGETIQITDGKVYINGVPLNESYCSGEMTYGGTAASALTLSSDEYFVMADNRSNNFDSRDSTVGAITERDIIGKVWLKMRPYSDFGLIS